MADDKTPNYWGITMGPIGAIAICFVLPVLVFFLVRRNRNKNKCEEAIHDRNTCNTCKQYNKNTCQSSDYELDKSLSEAAKDQNPV